MLTQPNFLRVWLWAESLATVIFFQQTFFVTVIFFQLIFFATSQKSSGGTRQSPEIHKCNVMPRNRCHKQSKLSPPRMLQGVSAQNRKEKLLPIMGAPFRQYLKKMPLSGGGSPKNHKEWPCEESLSCCKRRKLTWSSWSLVWTELCERKAERYLQSVNLTLGLFLCEQSRRYLNQKREARWSEMCLEGGSTVPLLYLLQSGKNLGAFEKQHKRLLPLLFWCQAASWWW